MKARSRGAYFLWALEGFQRHVANSFRFTESDRIRKPGSGQRTNNNIFDFLDSDGYIRRKADASISSETYAIYRLWCGKTPSPSKNPQLQATLMVANAEIQLGALP